MNDNAPKALFVWGYVDMHSGKHKVRIRRAIQQEGNMFELAKDPNLLLPVDPIRVELLLHSQLDTTIVEMLPVVYPKEEGTFSSEQNIIHEVDYPIPRGTSCSIQVQNLATGEIITSSKVNAPTENFLFPKNYGWYEPLYSFNTPDEPFYVEFSISRNLVQKLLTEIKYVDVLKNGDTVCQKAIFEGQAIYADGGFTRYTREFELDYLFNIFNRVIPNDPNVKFRWFYRFNFKDLVASSSLRSYLKLAERFRDNRKFYFSNINGGYGIFYASNYSETGDIQPTHSFPETLSTSSETKELKFTRYIFRGNYVDPDTANIHPLF